jgi:thiol-disulfide isomerase/thioredoxin
MHIIDSKEAGAWVTYALDLIQSHLSWPILFVLFLMGCGGLFFAYLLFKKYGSRIQIVEGLTSNSMDNPDEDSSVQLLMFTVDWCPHCKTAKPEWDKLVSNYDGELINGRKVVFVNYNCTQESDDIKKLIAKYNVEGYPTIKLIKDGQVIDFDAKPTEESLVQFLKASI